MIDLHQIRKTYGVGALAVTALHDVNFSIAENEFFTLLGPSGCGKTTLLRVIAGFEAPSGGAILLDGRDIAPLPPNKRPVNTVFQNYALFPHMTVAQNIAFGLECLGKPRAEVRDTVERMLDLVQMAHLAARRVSALSGGQQQRVALARALAPGPRILLLDEPLSALDMKLRKDMQLELKRLQKNTGITFIFVTHDQEEAMAMSDRIAVMSNGRVHQIAAPRDLYDRPADRFVGSFIGESNFLPAQITAQSGGVAQVDLGPIGQAQVASDLPQGAAVSALIRPEHIQLGAAPGLPALSGRVETAVFLGTDTQLHVVTDQGLPIMVRVQNGIDLGPVPAQGERITLSLPPAAIRLVTGAAA